MIFVNFEETSDWEIHANLSYALTHEIFFGHNFFRNKRIFKIPKDSESRYSGASNALGFRMIGAFYAKLQPKQSGVDN